VQDLYLGLALMAMLSAIAFAAGIALAGDHRWIGNGMAVGTVLLTILYIRFGWDDIRLAKLLPVSNLVIVGNLLPLSSTFLAGIVWRRIAHWRRVVGVTALWIAGGYAAVAPLLVRTPVCKDNWTDIGVCLQTTPATCTPACAATLLRIHGISATEGEMARLCLTGPHGTNWAGLYHALKVKTNGTHLDVVILSGPPASLLEQMAGPTLVSVGLPLDTAPNSYYRTNWVWNPGEQHSVIVLGTTEEGLVQIVDPDPRIEYETWLRSDLSALWRGHGMALVRRKFSP